MATLVSPFTNGDIFSILQARFLLMQSAIPKYHIRVNFTEQACYAQMAVYNTFTLTTPSFGNRRENKFCRHDQQNLVVYTENSEETSTIVPRT